MGKNCVKIKLTTKSISVLTAVNARCMWYSVIKKEGEKTFLEQICLCMPKKYGKGWKMYTNKYNII